MHPNMFNSKLGTAAIKNDYPMVKILLRSGKYDANLKQRNGYTLLMDIVRRGHFNIAHLLLEKGADPNCKTTENETALKYACRAGFMDIARLLVQFGADTTGTAGATALISAVHGDQSAVIKFLLEELKVNVNARDENGRTAASHACEKGLWSIVYLLHTYDANFDIGDHTNKTPLMFACEQKNETLVSFLLEKGVDVNKRSGVHQITALSIACRDGHREIVRLLLERKADIEHSVRGSNMAALALRHNHEEICFMLMEHRDRICSEDDASSASGSSVVPTDN